MTVGVRVHHEFVPCDRTDAVIAADVAALRRAPSPGPERYIALHNLAIALYSRHRCANDARDLDAAIIHGRGALRLLPARHPDRSVAEGNLSMFLAARRGPGDLDEASIAGRRALASTSARDRDYPAMLAQVAQVEYELFQRDGDPAWIEAAVARLDQAMALRPIDSEGAAGLHLNNATMRLSRHQSVGSHPEDLDTALSTLETVVALDPEWAPAGLLNAARSSLAQALNVRFLRDGVEADRIRSAELQRELLRSGDPVLAQRTEAVIKDNVATDALMSYLRTGRLSELDRAVQAEEGALAVAATGTAERPALLANLGICLLLRHRARHGIAATSSVDLVEGLQCARDAVETGGEGAYSASSAGILGSILLQRAFHDPGAVDEVELAERMFTRVLAATPPGDPQRPAARTQLAICRASCSVRAGDADGLEDAITEHQAALEALPPGSPLRPGALGVRSDLLLSAAVLSGGEDGMVERAVVASRAAVAAGAVLSAATAFSAARQWGDAMWRLGRLPEAGEGYAAALRQLHDVCRAQLALSEKDVTLSHAADVTERATVSLAYCGDPDAAALAVETGRAVVLSEALGVEQSQVLDRAARTRPDLVQAHLDASRHLRDLQRQALSAGQVTALAAPAPAPAPTSDVGPADLAQAKDAVDASIAALEDAVGVELLRAPDSGSLRAACAAVGIPIVYVVSSAIGGVALIVDPAGSVCAVALARLSTARAEALVLQFGQANQDEDDDAAELATSGVWSDVMAPVTAALDGWSEAVLVPVGLLAGLPLHAAGARRDDGTWQYADDHIVYAYAPNVRVMAMSADRARRRPEGGLLLVADPRTDEPWPPLPGAIQECELVQERFAAADVLAFLTADQATRGGVLHYLPHAAVVHLACHAAVDPDRPLDSALVLAGSDRLSLRDLLLVDLPATRLAVLSACSTAVVGDRLRDEVVSLPSALVQAGVAGVVGALWEVDDVASALLLARFHGLRNAGRLSGAAALAGAQRWLRSATNAELAGAFPQIDLGLPGDPQQLEHWRRRRDFAAALWWAPFVYVGA